MSDPAPAIEVRDLAKSYGDVRAVAGIDLAVARGEVFSLLGPNGAGKTTTVEILEGFRPRDGGDVRVLGADPGEGDAEFRARIGVVLQTTGVDRYLTVAEVVEQFRGYYPAPRETDELLEVVGLTDQRDQRVKRLSGGQQRRLDVAVGLAGDPELLFLDEPTTGFDPGARRQAWQMIAGLKDLGKTVLLTTHYMEEAQVLADRVGVIVDGRIVAEGRPDELGGVGAETTISLLPLADRPDVLAGVVTAPDGRWELNVDDPVPVLHALTEWAITGGRELPGLEVSRRSLEDVYLQLTEEAESDEAAVPAPAGPRRRRSRR